MKSTAPADRLAEHVVGHGDGKRDALALDPLLLLAIDALQVQVGDAVVVAAEEGDRIASAIGVMARVEAKRHLLAGRSASRKASIWSSYSTCVSAWGWKTTCSPRRSLARSATRCVVSINRFQAAWLEPRRPGGLTGEQIGISIVDEHQEAAAQAGHQPAAAKQACLSRSGQASGSSRWPMANGRRHLQPAASELGLQGRQVRGQVAVRPELGPLVAGQAISSRKRCQGICLGSLGNQTPQESGALPSWMFMIVESFSQ